MRTVTTVTGDIAAESLGFCQSHEHICIMPGRSSEVNADLLICGEAESAAELGDYRASGGRAIVDAQPVGCGRDARFLERVSRAGGVSVVASTGFHRTVFYPEDHWIFSASEDELAAVFIAELTEGMYVNCDASFPSEKTDVRAGQIKTALDASAFAAPHGKLFSAAAEAARRTERTLMAHIERGSDPLALAKFLASRGVNLKNAVFCHMDRAADDLGIHREICRMGIFLEYDTICRPKYHSDEREAEIIISMLDAGFEDNLLMGLDTTKARLARYGGIPGLSYIIGTFIPFLTSRGVPDARIRKAFIDNPARAFSHAC